MIRPLYRLLRPCLSFVNGISALGGYLLFPARLEGVPAIAALAGVTLMAAGGSALNQVLERDLDRLMVRTRNRPLPTGDLTPPVAVAVGLGTSVVGFVLLTPVSFVAAFLGAAAFAWYLGLYTPLKRRTTFALLAGALCGSVPPVIGWCLAGGSPLDFRVLLLAGVLYIWQIPHFRLFQMRHVDDYRSAGLPVFLERRRDIPDQGRIWLLALVAAAMLLPAFGLVEPRYAPWFAAFTMALPFIIWGRYGPVRFVLFNLFPLVVTLVLLLQK